MPKDLFGNEVDLQAMADAPLQGPRRKRKDPVPKGHAWMPGTGPDGETCKTCKHRARILLSSKVVSKCGLNKRRWTGGRGSDIRAGDPACKFWEKER